jgi:hypothetical protein
MMSKPVVIALAMALTAAALSAPSRVGSQQNPPCANADTTGKTDKQLQLDDCNCEQASTPDKPTYRVGAAPFGHTTVPRASRSHRVGARLGATRTDPNVLYSGLLIPDLKDRQSPEVVGLLAKVLPAREEARRAVEDRLEHARKTLQMAPNNWYANKLLKSPKVTQSYNNFLALQNNGAWVSWPTFDWRKQGLDVGPVLNQGTCGSCWAFAAMSAYQSSWNLEQLRLGVGFWEVAEPEYDSHTRVPSVQQLLNCIGQQKGDCTGGWHGAAFAFMVSTHVPHIPDKLVRKDSNRASIEEYTGRVSRCDDLLRHRKVKRGGATGLEITGPDSSPSLPANSDQILTAYDRALAWGYVNEKDPEHMPSVAQIKQALIEHGPLAMPIRGDACFSVYQGGVFNGHSKGDINHVLVLIGWDDDKQAWLVKNSWGEQWGEQGFGWVAYGSNNVGLYAAWIQPTPATMKQ